MFFYAPKDIYGPNLFKIFVSELGGPKKVWKYLGVHERTIWRWLANDDVPRSAVLALYWETKYGRSTVFADQVNEIRTLYRKVCLLQEELNKAEKMVADARRLNTGTANEVTFEEIRNSRELPPDTYGPSTLSLQSA